MKIWQLREGKEERLISKIQSVLGPELLLPKFRKMCPPDNKMWGHCYAATEALYHMLGGKDAGWVPVRAKDDDGIVHWWMEHRPTGRRLDPTAEQYTSVGKEPPYDRGRAAGFLTREPSKRAQQIIDLVT